MILEHLTALHERGKSKKDTAKIANPRKVLFFPPPTENTK